MSEIDDKFSGELQFHVDASILVQLGEQLVTRRSVALAELIKNSYDADATEVIVTLENVRKSHGRITINDNGQGMTVEEIKNNWMRLATNNKQINTVSPKYERPRAGQKGIGRFAVRRLANNLILESVAFDNNRKVRTLVEFNWSTQFQPGDTLTDISVIYSTEKVEDSAPTGVTLHLNDVKDIWNDDDVGELRRDLSSLINPFPNLPPILKNNSTSLDQSFSFLLIAPEFPKAEGELSEGFLASAWSVLFGSVTNKGKPSYELAIKRPQEIATLKPQNEHFADLHGVEFTIYAFVYTPTWFKDSFLGVRDAQRIGRERGGVRVYLDKFRVFPYGDTAHGDDWLELDIVRALRTTNIGLGLVNGPELEEIENKLGTDRPELLTPGNNQLYGVVNISQRDHPQFGITTSREGFVENDAFKQLRRFLQLGIRWMTLQYARLTFEEREKRRDDRRTIRQTPISELIKEIQIEILDARSIPDQSKTQILSNLDTVQKEASVREEQQIDELTMLRILSSTGTVVSMMNHQLRSMLSGLHSVAVDLNEFRTYLGSNDTAQLERITSDLELWSKQVEQQVSQLGFLLGGKAREERTRPLIRVVVDDMVSPLSLYMKDNGIEFINEVPENLRTPPIYEAEFYALLLHVFSNALKAVREESVRRIAVTAERVENEIHIYIRDTGKGMLIADREVVFKPFRTTTSSPDPVFGVGTGLGLKIVRDILANYNGSAHFIDVAPPWRTCLEIILRN